jgi:hypothetical protein
MDNKVVEYAHLVIKLLQDVVYDDDKVTWNDLLTYQVAVRDYFAKIGIDIYLDEREGFAFLRQNEDEDHPLPRLVRRTPLSYDVTLLCAMLREVLEEFDLGDTESRKCFITGQELREKIELFFPEPSNKVKLLEKLDRSIQSAVKLGFLKEVSPEGTDSQEMRYEVRRIIKAKITNAKLEEIKQELNQYAQAQSY